MFTIFRTVVFMFPAVIFAKATRWGSKENERPTASNAWRGGTGRGKVDGRGRSWTDVCTTTAAAAAAAARAT